MYNHPLSKLEALNKKNNFLFIKDVRHKYGNNYIKKIKIKKNIFIEKYLYPHTLYYMNKGVITRSFWDLNGNPKTLRILTQNDIFGFTTLYENVPFTWNTMTLQSTELYTIPYDILNNEIAHKYNLIGYNFQYYLCESYTHWQGSLSIGIERINYTLIRLAYSLGNKNSNMYCLPQYITHRIIADLSSVSRSYVTRYLYKLEQEKIISKTNYICILNLNELINRTPCHPNSLYF